MMDDLIGRQDAIDAHCELCGDRDTCNCDICPDVEVFQLLPSAQPEEIALHESCTDCPLYDKDRHRCPRFNKVIPETLREAQPEQRWIPIKWHDCTDEEREKYGFSNDVVAVFDCEMPDDDQPVLVTTSHGYVSQDVCYIDDGYSLDSGWDWIDDIKAWMPLPEAYTEGNT